MSWERIWLALMLAVVVVAAVVGWLAYRDVLDQRPVVLVLLALAAVLFAALAIRSPADRQASAPRRSWSASAGPHGPWTPMVATVTTFAALIMLNGARDAAVVLGLAAGAITWVVGSWRITFLARPNTVNTRVYADLLEKHREVDTRLTKIPRGEQDRIEALEAREHMAWVHSELALDNDESGQLSGLDWATGYGYVNVWMALHRAEESLLEFAPAKELNRTIVHDRLRIAGSRLTDLSRKVQSARKHIRDSQEETHRTEVISVRRAVNEFRDSRWDGLARARNQLNASSFLTAWVAYLVLFVAVILRAPPLAVAFGGIFFLVGALAGLFAQLRADARADEAVEDLGLTAARLRQTVIASGLAGVGGVLVTAMLTDSTGSDGMRTLADVFKDVNPGQLFVAAVFGLSPQLLIERLTSVADRYRADLKETGTGDEDRLVQPGSLEEPASPAAGSSGDGGSSSTDVETVADGTQGSPTDPASPPDGSGSSGQQV